MGILNGFVRQNVPAEKSVPLRGGQLRVAILTTNKPPPQNKTRFLYP